MRFFYSVSRAGGRKAWEFKTYGEIFASPFLTNEVAYVASNDGYLYAINLNSGRLRWKKDLKSSLFASPVVVDGVIYIHDNRGKLTAYR